MPISFSNRPSIEMTAAGVQATDCSGCPVNATNNVIHTILSNIELDEFASGSAAGRDALSRVIAYENVGNYSIVDRYPDVHLHRGSASRRDAASEHDRYALAGANIITFDVAARWTGELRFALQRQVVSLGVFRVLMA